MLAYCGRCGKRKFKGRTCLPCTYDYPNEAKLDAVREHYNVLYYKKAGGLNVKWRDMRRYGNFTAEEKRVIADRFAQYLSNARARGKDVSTYVKRQCYYLLAVRWGIHYTSKSSRFRIGKKAYKTTNRLRWYRRVMNKRVRNRIGKKYGIQAKKGFTV